MKTLSTMLALNTVAPSFILPDVISSSRIAFPRPTPAKAHVLFFICNHCPFVKHIIEGLVKLTHDYQNKEIDFIGINSNDIARYPDDSPEKMKELAHQAGFNFPYCFDETQEVAHAFKAACTPDFFIFDAHLQLVYRGQMDDSRPGNGIPVTAADLRQALNAILSGLPVSPEQKPSMGCNIKWKSTDMI